MNIVQIPTSNINDVWGLVSKNIQEALSYSGNYTDSDFVLEKLKEKKYQLWIIWDKSKPSGDAVRLMDVRRAANYGFKPSVTLSEGISETMDWYRKYKERTGERYNAFTETRLVPNG